MRVESRTCAGAALFLGIIAVVYWFWSREDTGTTCLVFGIAAYLLIGTYLYLQLRRRHGIPRPEDRFDAEQSDGAGEVGFFPAASIWPAGLGLGGFFIGLALVFGNWYWIPAGMLIFGSLIGFATEAEAREEGPDDPGLPIDVGDGGSPATSESVPSAYQR